MPLTAVLCACKVHACSLAANSVSYPLPSSKEDTVVLGLVQVAVFFYVHSFEEELHRVMPPGEDTPPRNIHGPSSSGAMISSYSLLIFCPVFLLVLVVGVILFGLNTKEDRLSDEESTA
ncbi:hypothetical protein BDV11DRAFT_198011 [Aspergillus similis]